ncbi:MAG TPA: metalloregulator ArsR/SmtB family transcription factor [Vicinamibacteria bacterium]|nr:metalloregulator ArsR/SmtB family transcription factor [Vicinamibacteria bacterium]
MAALLELVGGPRRREILRLLWHGERTAGEVHRALPDVTFGAVSQHLRALEEASVLQARREGRHRYYRAKKDVLGPLRPWLEATWDDALYRLRLAAELEEARRGPRGRPRGRDRQRAVTRRPR